MMFERVVLVLCAQWAVLLAGIGGGMMAERQLDVVDIRVIMATVVVLGVVGGVLFARQWPLRGSLVTGSVLFLLSNAAIDLLMIEAGTSAHVAGSAACAMLAAATFCAAASMRASVAPRHTVGTRTGP